MRPQAPCLLGRIAQNRSICDYEQTTAILAGQYLQHVNKERTTWRMMLPSETASSSEALIVTAKTATRVLTDIFSGTSVMIRPST
jgi:hypothetical protein